MTMRSLGLALAAVLLSGGAAAAQTVMVGGTYSCSGSKRVVESCGPVYCEIQVLNAAAPDGKGAHLQIYRDGIAQFFSQCSVTGGVATPEKLTAAPAAPRPGPAPGPKTPAPAPAARAPVNPAYVAGAGAGVTMPGQAAAGAPARRLVAAAYHCTSFIGSPPNGHLATMPGFTLTAGGGYTHQNGGGGKVTTSGGTLEFHGGPLDGQAATFDAGATGKGTVHLYNASRSRTVIDCDGA